MSYSTPRSILSDTFIDALKDAVPQGVRLNVNLAKVSRWRIGGIADCIVSPSNTQELAAVLTLLKARAFPYVVIGSTSNLLFSDDGIRVVIVQIGDAMSEIVIEGRSVRCQSGAWVPGFARTVARAGLSGIEHTCGIPGTVGGLICMNGGSQRKGIGEHVASVLAVTPDGEIKRYRREECQFAYRHSIFQNNRNVIAEAELRFPETECYTEIRKRMLGILQSRKKKFPKDLPNCGSVFVSNPGMYEAFGPPGEIIEKLGLKGLSRGDAQISPVHANFIVNMGAAKAADVIFLITHIRALVKEKTGYLMQPEARYIDSHGHVSLPVGDAGLH